MSASQKMLAFAEQSSWIRKMFEEGSRLKAQYGPDQVFDFSLGNPDIPPPPAFSETLFALAQSQQAGQHAYMANNGYAQTRAAVAARLSEEQELPLGQEDVLMTCGAAGGLNVIMKALLDPGDEVILFSPFFVEYTFYVDNHGGLSKIVPTDSRFNLDLAALAAAIGPKTKALIINSPNNPTGQVYPAETLNALGVLLENKEKELGRSIYLIADEPYRKIVYDGFKVPSVMAAVRRSIVVSSFSKDLSLAGERIGYIALHPRMPEKESIYKAMVLAHRILGFVNAPALMQRAVAQVQDLHVDMTLYAQRREAFCAVLEAAGMSFLRPKGAFYLFPQSPIDDVRFCQLLLEERILAVPGRGFGRAGHIRLAFCVDVEIINRAKAGFQRVMERVQHEHSGVQVEP
jgi:aspartate aminotransferase